MSIQIETPQTTDQDLERRAKLTRGLRELADFFDAHPELPIPKSPEFEYCVLIDNDADGVAAVKQIAAELGVEVSYGRHPEASTKFAGLKYRAFYVPREDMRRYYAYSTYSGVVEPDDAQSERAA